MSPARPRRAPVARALVVAAGLAACGAEDGLAPPTGPLVDARKWSPVERADDPFSATPPPACALPGFHIEGAREPAVLEIDTDACAFVTVGQPLAEAVPAGFPLEINVAHLALTAPGAASATVAVAVDATVVWQLVRRIPSPSAVVVQRFALPFDARRGTRILFHVRNHGSNTYYLQWLGPARSDPAEPPS